MKNPNRQDNHPIPRKATALLLVFGAFFIGGCESPDYDDGTIINELLLPTDTLLNLACADAGVGFERCVLEDP
jgi:hypothetical protein